MLMLDPFAPLESYVTRSMGRMGFLPPADVALTDDRTVVTMDLPGLTEQDVEVEVLGDELIVRGERSRQELPQGATWAHSERLFGSFERRIRLPEGVEPETIDAAMSNGVLRVEVPKPEHARRRTIAIGSDRRELAAAAA